MADPKPPSDLISPSGNSGPPSDLVSPSQSTAGSFSREPEIESEGLMSKVAPYAKGTALSSAIGFATPEILTTAGMLAPAVPGGAPLAPFLLAGGQLARGARLGTTLASGGGYLAGQGLKAVTPEKEKSVISAPGINITRGDIAETAGEIGAPTAASIAKKLITTSAPYRALMSAAEQKGFVSGNARTAANELANLRNKITVNQVLNLERLRVSPNDVSSYEKVLKKLLEVDRDTQRIVANDIATAEAQAESILNQYKVLAEKALTTSKDTAQRLINEGDAKAKKLIDSAMDEANRKMQIRGRAQAAGGVAEKRPQETLQRVGNPNEFESTTGGNIQNRINQVVSDEQKALNSAYTTDKSAVDNLVQGNESKGLGVAQTPSYSKIVDYLDRELGVGAYEGSTFQRTTNPTIINTLKNIRKAVTGNELVVEKGGRLVEVKGKPPSFNALNQERQKVGDAYAGKPPEGFEAITKNQAKDLYKLIRDAQVEYAGGKDGAFDNLLRNYSEGKELLNALKIPAGKKIVKKDLINPEYFTYDPSGLPREFFSTRKKVQDLVNLTGDASFVEQQASNHVARVLKDADAKGIKNYMEKNAEWLDLMPNLRARLQNHYSAVASSERIVPKTGALAKALKTEVQALPSVRQTEAEKIQKEAAKAAEDVLSGGKKEAKRLTSEGAAEAGKVKYSGEKFEPLVGPGDTMTQIRKLITGGNTELLRRAAPSIKSDPEVARAFKEAVKLELSQLDPRSLAGGKNTRSEWETKLKPALLETGLIDSRLAKQISDRMKVVELTMEPNQKAQALFFILRQTLAGKLGELETGK